MSSGAEGIDWKVFYSEGLLRDFWCSKLEVLEIFTHVHSNMIMALDYSEYCRLNSSTTPKCTPAQSPDSLSTCWTSGPVNYSSPRTGTRGNFEPEGSPFTGFPDRLETLIFKNLIVFELFLPLQSGTYKLTPTFDHVRATGLLITYTLAPEFRAATPRVVEDRYPNLPLIDARRTIKAVPASPAPGTAVYERDSYTAANMANGLRCSTGRFQDWELGVSSRLHQEDDSISPTDNRSPVVHEQPVFPQDVGLRCVPKPMPPQTSSAPASDHSVDLRDSAGPSSLAFKNLDFRPTSKSKGKASIRNASYQSEQEAQLENEQLWQNSGNVRLGTQPRKPIRAPMEFEYPEDCGGWNNGKSLSETFAYYADDPRQKGFWSTLLQARSRRLCEEPPKPADNNKHANAALCEKVIRNGGAHTAAGTRDAAVGYRGKQRISRYGENYRPFRINDGNASSSAKLVDLSGHPQQQCQNPGQHSRYARCEMPVKSCLHCAAVASCSGIYDHDDHKSVAELSNITGHEARTGKSSSRWKKMRVGLQRAFS
nr:hypothetical protein CFP56_69487 [Quercus suber]